MGAGSEAVQQMLDKLVNHRDWDPKAAEILAERLDEYITEVFKRRGGIDENEVKAIVCRAILNGNPEHWRTKNMIDQELGVAFESRRTDGTWKSGSFMFLGGEEEYRRAEAPLDKEGVEDIKLKKIELVLDEETGRIDVQKSVESFVEVGFDLPKAEALVNNLNRVVKKFIKLREDGDIPMKHLKRDFGGEFNKVIEAALEEQFGTPDEPDVEGLRTRAIAELTGIGMRPERAQKLLSDMERLADKVSDINGLADPEVVKELALSAIKEAFGEQVINASGDMNDLMWRLDCLNKQEDGTKYEHLCGGTWESGTQAFIDKKENYREVPASTIRTERRYMVMVLWTNSKRVNCVYSKSGETLTQMYKRMASTGEHIMIGDVVEREVPL
jgi:hypothetical protein